MKKILVLLFIYLMVFTISFTETWPVFWKGSGISMDNSGNSICTVSLRRGKTNQGEKIVFIEYNVNNNTIMYGISLESLISVMNRAVKTKTSSGAGLICFWQHNFLRKCRIVF